MRERWGVGPERIIDLLALMGDASDNVPGVPGVGEKKAAQFIQKFGDLEGVLANAAAIGGKTGEAVAASVEVVRLARTLVTIDTNIPVTTTLDALRPTPRDDAELIARLSRYNFRSLMQDLKLDVPATPAASSVSPAGALDVETVWGPAPRAALTGTLRAAERVVVHLEDVGGKPGRIFFAWKDGRDRAAMVPVDAGSRVWIAATLADPAIRIAGFDLKALSHRLGPVVGVVGDLLIADYLRYPEQKHGLEEVCVRHLGHGLGTGWGEGIRTVLQLDRTLDSVLDAWEARKVYTEIELPVLPILAEMERVGILVDRSAFAVLAVELEARLLVLEREVHAAAGETFLIGSTQQLAHILYEKLGLKGAKKIKTGLSTDADTLDKLRDQHPLPGTVLAWREATKLKSTYVDALPTFVAADGRIHTTLRSGRRGHRPALLLGPEPPEHPGSDRGGSPDPRLLRGIAGDRSSCPPTTRRSSCGCSPTTAETGRWSDSFRNGEDIHRRTASRDLQHRAVPRHVGAAARGEGDQLRHRLRNGSVSPRERSPHPTVGGPVLHRWVLRPVSAGPLVHGGRLCAGAGARVQRDALRAPSSRRGARRRRTRWTAPRAERVAINSPIQGTAADIIKLAMLRGRTARSPRAEARLLLQVHDELVLEVPEAEVASVRAAVKAEMEAVATLAVPLVVDTGVASTWGGAH